MEFYWNPNTKCTVKLQSSISMHLFPDAHSFSKISQTSGYNQEISKQCCLPPLSFKISRNCTSFHISLNYLKFYLSPECLLNFLWLIYSTMCRKFFSIYGVHIPRKCNESIHFYFCASPPLKTQSRVFWKFVSLKTKWVEKTMIFFIKNQSENMKIACNISSIIFCVIYNFSKYDVFTVYWIISIK